MEKPLLKKNFSINVNVMNFLISLIKKNDILPIYFKLGFEQTKNTIFKVDMVLAARSSCLHHQNQGIISWFLFFIFHVLAHFEN